MKQRVALVDYGSGNYRSVFNALTFIGIQVVEARDAADLKEATHIVLPGVGAFGSAMERLQRESLAPVLIEQVREMRKPFLGICVGMQVLADEGHEFANHEGLGLIHGVTERVPNRPTYRLPHIGWNELELVRSCALFNEMSGPPIVYFLHSYHLQPSDPSVVVAVSDYGSPVVAAVQQENIFGVQFHPEKSQEDGLQVLRNFCSIDA